MNPIKKNSEDISEEQKLTFEQLLQVTPLLFNKVCKIERLLTSKESENKPEADCWFDLIELCDYFPDKPSKATVYGWIHNSLIPYHKKSKKLYFLKAEIDIWLKEGRKKTVSEIDTLAEEYISKKNGGSYAKK